MKIKVLDYKNDGNTVTTKWFDVEELFPGVYISKYEENSNLYQLIFGNVDKNVYVIDGLYSQETILNNKDYLHEVVADFPKFLIEKPFIRKIDIEFAKQSGFDYQILEQRREEIFAIRKQQEAEEKAKKEQKSIEYAAREAERINERLQALKDGKNISYQDLLDIIGKYNISIAPRTLGAIRKQVASYSYINRERGFFKPKTARSTVDSIFQVVKKVVEI